MSGRRRYNDLQKEFIIETGSVDPLMVQQYFLHREKRSWYIAISDQEAHKHGGVLEVFNHSFFEYVKWLEDKIENLRNNGNRK